jgi:hypothetical protein
MNRGFVPEASNLGDSIKSFDKLGQKYIPKLHLTILN